MAKKFPDVVSDQRLAAIASLYQTAVNDPSGPERIVQLPIENLRENPFQPRTISSPEDLADLAASIREHGLLQPLVCCQDPAGNVTVIAGHRRLQAAKIAGCERVTVIIREVEKEEDLRVLALIENVHREDLHAVDRARAFSALVAQMGSPERAAEVLGMKRNAFGHWLRVAGIDPDVLDVCAAIPGISLRTLLDLVRRPAKQRLAEAKRLLARARIPPGQETPKKQTKAVSRSKPFVVRLAQQRFNYTVQVRTGKRSGHLSKEEIVTVLREVLNRLESETGEPEA